MLTSTTARPGESPSTGDNPGSATRPAQRTSCRCRRRSAGERGAFPHVHLLVVGCSACTGHRPDGPGAPALGGHVPGACLERGPRERRGPGNLRVSRVRRVSQTTGVRSGPSIARCRYASSRTSSRTPIVLGPGPGRVVSLAVAGVLGLLWFHGEPIRLPDHRPHGWYARSAAVAPSRAGCRVGSLDPASLGTSWWRWRWAWSRPRLGTAPIASGLRSLVRRGMTSASWPISCPDGPGTVNLAGIRVIPGRIDPPAGRPQALAFEGCPRHGGLLAMGPGARLAGGRRVSNGGAVAGPDLLHRGLPSGRPRRRVLVACYAGPERGGLRRWPGCSWRVASLAWRVSASWLMVAAAGAATMGVWRSVSSWTGPSLRPAVFGSSAVPGRIPGPARGRTSGSAAGWGCCGRCMR